MVNRCEQSAGECVVVSQVYHEAAISVKKQKHKTTGWVKHQIFNFALSKTFFEEPYFRCLKTSLRNRRFSLILFFSSNVCWRFWLSWRIFPLEPLSEVLDVVREGLMLAMCIVLEFGQMATEANELVVDKKDEPENSEEKQKEIRCLVVMFLIALFGSGCLGRKVNLYIYIYITIYTYMFVWSLSKYQEGEKEDGPEPHVWQA